MTQGTRPAVLPTTLAAAATLLLFLALAPAAGAARRALLIGIDDYLAPGLSDLSGCGNDVELMRTVLVGDFDFPPENVRVLRDAEATRQGILDAIRTSLIEPTEAGDVVVLHYSGHGSQMLDDSGDEPDGWDESLVAHDSRVGDVRDLRDDEINRLMAELAAKTPHVTFILDSCHSGSAARAAEAGTVPRQVPPDLRPPPPPDPGAGHAVEGPDDFRALGAGYVLISGCRANQLSNETRFDDRRHGALTWFLARALQKASPGATYRDVMEPVRSDVSQRFPSQTPQIEGTGIDQELFGVAVARPRAFVPVQPVGDGTQRATLSAGRAYGVAPGSELRVFPQGTREFDGSVPAVATVRVVSAEAFESEVEVLEGTVGPHTRAVLDEIVPRVDRVTVHVGDDPGLEPLKGVVDGFESMERVAERVDAQIRVRRDGDRYLLEGRDLDVLGNVPAAHPDALEQLEAQLARWGRWHALLNLGNPASALDVDLEISLADDPDGEPVPESVTPGTRLRLTLTNRSAREVWAVVVGLWSDGGDQLVYPQGQAREAIAPGRSDTVFVRTFLPPELATSTDRYKMIAATRELDPGFFALPPASRGAVPETRGDEDALGRFLRLSAQGLTRHGAPVVVDDWAVVHRAVRVDRSEVASEGVALHFDDAAAARAAAESVRSAGGARDAAASGTGDSTVVVLSTAAERSGNAGEISVGRAFQEAYRERERWGARRAEPVLEAAIPRSQSAPDPDAAGSRGSGGAGDDERAAADVLWSHRTLRVPEAWAALRARGAVEGAEASGVVVAHPDTGYLPHPELLDPAGDDPLWVEVGWDYSRDRKDPRDERVKHRPQDNPAHGTGSGSAIVSPTGCQLDDEDGERQCPTGVARGARLVPVRVNSSVVNFSTERMSQAILDLSGDDRSHVGVATDLASIAMGGVPSWRLWKAVRTAERRGYLIIAAAGNYVRTVVWPARFDSVIAVAAVNVGCRPWAHSSRGPAVDFAATGESVWRATIDGDDWVTGMGTGTTYATSSTAGVAALWVARHKGSPEFEALRDAGELTRAFRLLATETAWQPGGDDVPAGAACDDGATWDEERYGAGILDAARLLEAPLPAVAVSRGAARGDESLVDLPLWRSLYPPGPAADAAEADYRRLFGLDQDADLEEVAVYEAEVAYHYATDELLAAAFDAVVARPDRSADSWEEIRERLRSRDLSSDLRASLP